MPLPRHEPDPGAWALRTGSITHANRRLRRFYADRNPAWIIRACESLRRDGIEVPAGWLECEAWAKGRSRGRGHPANSAQLVNLTELYAVHERLWPMGKKETEKQHNAALLTWLAQELGFYRQGQERGWRGERGWLRGAVVRGPARRLDEAARPACDCHGRCAPVGDPGDIILADLSEYLLPLRNSLRVEQSTGPGWLTDEISMRVVFRCGGQPLPNVPTKLADGTNTVSSFVTLAAR